MLGVRRTSVTVIARQLQALDLIKYTRGKIQLIDIDGLEDTACECRSAIKAQHERLLGQTWNGP
jgi:hypothetical protein